MVLRKKSIKFPHETKGKYKEKDDINYKICDTFSQVILDQKWTVYGERYNVQCNRKWHWLIFDKQVSVKNYFRLLRKENWEILIYLGKINQTGNNDSVFMKQQIWVRKEEP